MIFVSETTNGDRIEYRDRKRYMWVISLLTILIPTYWIVVFLATENPLWLCGPLLTIFRFIPVLDMIFGEDPHNPPEEVVEQMAADSFYRRLLFCALPLYFVNFYGCFWILGTHDVPLWLAAALTLGASAVSGGAIVVGHELGHKLNRWDQLGAMTANAFSAYGHFRLEHNRGHHTQVATPEDVASAKMGESVYRFAIREQYGALRRGIEIERERLAKHGHNFWNWRNEILQGYTLTLTIYGSVVAALGMADAAVHCCCTCMEPSGS
ncbi:MAG: fatty acid desaturase [Planctomycetaceae bacterium]